jgi:hypothetical protein
MAHTLVRYITAVVALLEHHGMDDPGCLTCPGHTRQKAHALLSRILDQHKLV